LEINWCIRYNRKSIIKVIKELMLLINMCAVIVEARRFNNIIFLINFIESDIKSAHKKIIGKCYKRRGFVRNYILRIIINIGFTYSKDDFLI